MGIEFYQTLMGKRFYESTMPALLRNVEEINKKLEKIEAQEKAIKEMNMILDEQNKCISMMTELLEKLSGNITSTMQED